MAPSAALFLLAASLMESQEGNTALLGVVATDGKDGASIACVLPDSPAGTAGLKKGDLIQQIGDVKVRKASDVDAAMKQAQPGRDVTIRFTRGKEAKTATARPVARQSYRSDALKPQTRGKIGFKAPDWHVASWSGVKGNPPSRETTKGKVVVIHAFQSW